jgi:hypothetical protein
MLPYFICCELYFVYCDLVINTNIFSPLPVCIWIQLTNCPPPVFYFALRHWLDAKFTSILEIVGDMRGKPGIGGSQLERGD